MKKIFEEAKTDLPFLKAGEIVSGTVIERRSNAVFLDLGVLGTGIIYGREYLDSRDFLRDKKIGDKIFAKITAIENEEGFVELSCSEAGRELSWQTLLQKKESREPVEVKITGANRGGLTAEIQGISAFMPVSQLASEHYPKVKNGEPNKILEELRKFIGKNLKVRVLDVDQSQNKLIISERAQEEEKLNEVLAKYKTGDTVEGEITGIVDFGAFITFGPEKLEGLIHISELDWKLVESPSDVVRIGDRVRAKIIDVSRGKVSLSLKALKPDPWQEAEKKYKKGDVIAGEVLKFSPYGAFVQLSDNLQGLCHISEFGSRKRMEEILQIGKKYDFKVLLVDAENHKISLGMAEEKSQVPNQKPE